MEIEPNTLFFIIIIVFLFMSSSGGDGVSSQYEYNQLQKLKQQFITEYDSFKNMTHSTNFRNITGFKLSYSDVMNPPGINATYPIADKIYDSWTQNQDYMLLPDDVIELINSDIWIRSNADVSNIFPPNITSTLLSNITFNRDGTHGLISMPIPRFYEPAVEFSDILPPDGETYIHDNIFYHDSRNITFETGELSIEFTHLDTLHTVIGSSKRKSFNSQSDKWKMLNVKIIFNDKLENQKHVIQSKAIYDIQRGRLLAMSESAKFHSLFAFPHYMSMSSENDEDIYNDAKQLINDYWSTKNFVDTVTMLDLDEWYHNANRKCEFMAFFQLDPWNQYTKDQIKMIDEELKWPLGRPANLSSLPPITISSGLLYSPDCGLQFQFSNSTGKRYELQVRSIRIHIVFGIILFVVQIYLLLCQMNHTNTPSSINKISFYCFSMINLVDGSLATSYFVASGIFPELYLPLVISAFACFILASLFETRYLISVYASQINEQGVGILTLLRGNIRDNDETRPMIVPDEAAISSTLYVRLVFSLISFSFLILSSTSWPRNFRMMFEYIIIFVLNSYWIPQIFRNAVKGTPSLNVRRNQTLTMQRQNRIPLLWKFVIGTTIIRVLPVVYVFTYSSNIFRHHKDTRFAIILCLWITFQVIILYSQEVLGSRWFLPNHVIPEGYSYHKPISSQELLEHGASEDHLVDCAICMSSIQVYVEDIPETHKVDQESYMITPCSHIFHTSCLENWMSYKLQCPVCRAPLPPL